MRLVRKIRYVLSSLRLSETYTTLEQPGTDDRQIQNLCLRSNSPVRSRAHTDCTQLSVCVENVTALILKVAQSVFTCQTVVFMASDRRAPSATGGRRATERTKPNCTRAQNTSTETQSCFREHGKFRVEYFKSGKSKDEVTIMRSARRRPSCSRCAADPNATSHMIPILASLHLSPKVVRLGQRDSSKITEEKQNHSIQTVATKKSEN